MHLEGWHFAAMEEYGYMDTSYGLICRLARHLVQNYRGQISEEGFRNACYACKIDPDSFTDEDFDQLQRKIDELCRY